MIALLLAAALTTPALAQSAGFRDTGLGRTEGLVGIGFTLPLGNGRKAEPPRLELRLARDTINIDGSRQSNREARRFESRIGIALDGQQSLLLNGRPVERKQRNNLSTEAGIAIGVVAVLVIGGLLVADAARDASE
ncbi:hypothetical protein BWQ93_01055 [Sphingopyxis sp. QXT-31]|uniref:hypothetical protein n=1 Tax=Sphingopyxis sp. QXT-31 TaxID=1357916 RepID=UPI00097946D5|nr:hypothetical protein [Sphingopyxis sp. QXT-31]APZ97238.1 hypothetical protein BWQ93_01055 [Sphingopyxis sp. QXT-31]